MDDFEDFYDNYEFINEPFQIIARKIYKRNKSDPLDVYSNYEFLEDFGSLRKFFQIF